MWAKTGDLMAEIKDERAEIMWETWKTLRCKMRDEYIPVLKKSKKAWMTNEILELMEDRRKHTKDEIEYKEMDKRVKEKCHIAKQNYFEEQCEQIDHIRWSKPSPVHTTEISPAVKWRTKAGRYW